jgi:hypothetical protein
MDDERDRALPKQAMDDRGCRREHDRVLHRAPTLADLDGGSDIRLRRVAETTGYRSLDGKLGAR